MTWTRVRNDDMRLKQYFSVRELLNKGELTLEQIAEETGVPLIQVTKISEGARPADYILFQYSGTEQLCPRCHMRTTLPCLYCFYKEHPDAETVDVIKRPIRNMDRPCDIMLNTELLGEDDD